MLLFIAMLLYLDTKLVQDMKVLILEHFAKRI